MTCTGCGAPLEWWPISNHWASRLPDRGAVEVWTFICPARPNDTDLYHHPA